MIEPAYWNKRDSLAPQSGPRERTSGERQDTDDGLTVRYTQRAWKYGGLLVLTTICASMAKADVLGRTTLVERLLAQYEPIKTVSCEVRKVTKGPGGKIRTLSRVYYRRPDQIHVETVSPLKRRIISDGSRLYSYIEGDPRGFSRPVGKLDKDMAISLRKIPGTAMDHLLRLKGVPEQNLEATPGFPVRKGYKTDKLFAVLSLDPVGRLARIAFYDSPGMRSKTAQCEYSRFREVATGIWIPRLHRTVALIEGVETRETVRISNLAVNEPIANGLFVAHSFFEGIEFAENFEDIYEQ